MIGLLAAQVVTATVTTFARLDGPDGKPGSSLAVGFLVPMFGFGLNGLWCAPFHAAVRHRGSYACRRSDAATRRPIPAPTSDDVCRSSGADRPE